MPGYSGTPLAKKLGIKPGQRIYIDGGTANYRELVEPLPAYITFVPRLTKPVDMIHLFTKSRSDLAAKLARYLAKNRAERRDLSLLAEESVEGGDGHYRGCHPRDCLAAGARQCQSLRGR